MLLWKLVLVIGLVGLLSLVVLKIYITVTTGLCQSTDRLKEKTVIITGASAGIGKETALDLAQRGARIILGCRNVKKAASVRDEIIRRSGNKNVVVRELDLASLSSVRKFASGILKHESRLDILINNAGCAGMEKMLTEDGLEYQMQTNHFSHFLLTNLLLGLLKQTAPSRVINVSSLAHTFINKLDFSNLNSEISYDSSQVYSNSKLCQILFSRYLAPLIIKDGVTINCLHPGVVYTDIIQSFVHPILRIWVYKPIDFVSRQLFKTAKEGAQTSIHLAVAKAVETTTGEYFSDCKVAKTSKLAQDDALAKKLWEISEIAVKLTADERHF